MKKLHITSHIFLPLICWFLIAGCAAKPSAAPEEIHFTHISSETQYQVGDSINLDVEITSSKSISEVYFTVRSSPISRKIVTADVINNSIEVHENWIADLPGETKIEAYAIAGDGSVIGPVTTVLKIDASDNTTLAVSTPNPSVVLSTKPSSTPVNKASPTPTSMPVELKLNINVDNDYLFPGDCTMLRWKAEDVDAVWLDGDFVDREDAREICPTETTEFVLEGIRGEGKDTASVLVIVEESLADDSTGPEITEMMFEPDVIYTGDACSVSSSKFSVKITDESEVLMASIYYRVSSGNVVGEWMEVLLDEPDLGLYSYTFTVADLDESQENVTDGKLDYYVNAMDLMVNESDSEIESVMIKPCTTP